MKRFLDLFLVLVSLPAWLPLILVTACWVGASMGRPVLFRQERAGLHGRSFWLVKFRTMREEVDASGRLLPDEERLTRGGKFLRSLSLDELPELWNVLRGDMSLVGPRPLPVAYLPRYNAVQMRRHECLPGITGWAQINGRNLVDWERRFQMDVWYVENRSLFLDLKILCRTILAVFSRKGIAAEGTDTMHEFMGSGGTDTAAPESGERSPNSPDPSHRSG